MYWYRIEQSLGRNSIVGTTIRKPEDIPKHLDYIYSTYPQITWVVWKSNVLDVFVNPIKKLRKNISQYKVAYDHPGAQLTSNMLERLMQRMDIHLFSSQYFHGTLDAANLSIRGWTLIQNFAPSNPYTVQKHNGYQSPAERLNAFCYHDNWIQNLLISASLRIYRRPSWN